MGVPRLYLEAASMRPVSTCLLLVLALSAPLLAAPRSVRDPVLGVQAVAVRGGVLVVSVEFGSLANEIGVGAGDVIFECNGKPVRSVHQLLAADRRTGKDEVIQIAVHRHGRTFSFAQYRAPGMSIP